METTISCRRCWSIPTCCATVPGQCWLTRDHWPAAACAGLPPTQSGETCCEPCAGLQPDRGGASADREEQPDRDEHADGVDEARSDEAAGSGSDDDLMVVKRRDALDVAADAAAQHAQAGLGALGEGESISGTRLERRLRVALLRLQATG